MAAMKGRKCLSHRWILTAIHGHAPLEKPLAALMLAVSVKQSMTESSIEPSHLV